MAPNEIIYGKEIQIHSNVQNEDRKLLIRVPDGYEKTQDRYPVLYILDADFEALFVNSASAIEYVSATGLAPNMIIVGIKNTEYFRDMFPKELEGRPDAGGSDSFLEFFEKDLKPYIDENYRTAPFNILFGGSNAGMLTTYAMLAKPEIFNAYIASSPMLGWFPDFFPETAKNLFPKVNSLNRFLYITYGKADYDRVTSEVPKFVSVLETVAPTDFKWQSDFLETEGHVPYTSLYAGIRFIFPNWKIDDKDVTSFGLDGIQKYYSQLSEKYGFDVAIPEEVLTALGFEYYQEKKIDESITVIKHTIELYPNSDSALGFLGSLYRKNKDTTLAIEAFEKALKLNPGNLRISKMLDEIKSQEAI